MRIIAGLAGGLRLKAPANDAIRPTTDRVKESMFGTLGDLRGMRVLDLFAGSGALGLEALSRGAGEVVFVEKDRRHVRLIETNLGMVVKAIGGNAGRAEVVTGSVEDTVGRLAAQGRRFDLILADPPYDGAFGAAELLKLPALGELAAAGILAVEHPRTIRPDTTPASGWRLIKTSQYGQTNVSFLKRC